MEKVILFTISQLRLGHVGIKNIRLIDIRSTRCESNWKKKENILGSEILQSIENDVVVNFNDVIRTVHCAQNIEWLPFYHLNGQLLVNQFMLNGISHRYQFEQSISVVRDVGWYFSFLFEF